MIDVYFEGGKEIEEAFKKLEGNVQKKFASAAIRSASRPVLNEAKARVPVKTGNLKKSLKIKVKKINNGFISRVAADHKIGPHAHLVEYGHRIVLKNSKTGKKFYIGEDVKEHPFLTPAFDTKHPESYKIIEDKFKEFLGL